MQNMHVNMQSSRMLCMYSIKLLKDSLKMQFHLILEFRSSISVPGKCTGTGNWDVWVGIPWSVA